VPQLVACPMWTSIQTCLAWYATMTECQLMRHMNRQMVWSKGSTTALSHKLRLTNTTFPPLQSSAGPTPNLTPSTLSIVGGHNCGEGKIQIQCSPTRIIWTQEKLFLSF
jgi:hypothetical protein